MSSLNALWASLTMLAVGCQSSHRQNAEPQSMATYALAPPSLPPSAAPVAHDPPAEPLDDLIPRSDWEALGLVKLSDDERGRLAERIASLIRSDIPQGVVVIAPSLSTSTKARQIRQSAGLSEVPLRHARAVLVVVRSSLFNPLWQQYDSVHAIKEDAERQLNISGPKYHVYVFELDDDLRPLQVSHESFGARE